MVKLCFQERRSIDFYRSLYINFKLVLPPLMIIINQGLIDILKI